MVREGFVGSRAARAALTCCLVSVSLASGCSGESVQPLATAGEALSTAGEATCVTLQRGSFGNVVDATIKSTAQQTNFGANPVLRVSSGDEALVQFDLTSIPPSAAVTRATMKLYVNGAHGQETIEVHRVLTPWTEAAVTYSSFEQQFAAEVSAAFRVESDTALKSVDLTSLASAWISGAEPNRGVLLLSSSANAGDGEGNPTIFVSSDAGSRSKRPALEVCYSTAADHCSPNPCLNGGTCTNTQDGYSCECAPGYTGDNCGSAIDDCAGNPCLNGGLCSDTADGYSCSCAEGFGGTSCEVNVDECSPNPCQNGGVCTDGVAAFSCQCAPGYDGSHCEHLIDNCEGAPCHNGGTCTDVVDGYTCSCAAGFVGTNCDINVDDCVGSTCLNGGTCVDAIGAYTCSCTPDFGGEHCELNLNSCSQQPCLNGAGCTNVPGGYACTCSEGYTGANCEVDIDDCSPNPCANEGVCVDGVSDYSCLCPPDFSGENCETALAPLAILDGASPFTVSIPGVSADALSLPDATMGVSYSLVATISGGQPPYTLTVTGSPPTGLSIVQDGALVRIAGTSSSASRDEFSISVGDGAGVSLDRKYNLRSLSPAPSIATSSLARGKAGTFYSAALSAVNGTGTLSFSLVSGSVPGGLSLTSSGSASATLSGTPTAAAAEVGENGTSSFTVEVSDQTTNRVTNLPAPRSATRAFTLNIRLAYSQNIFPQRSSGPSLTTCTACHTNDPDLSSAAHLINAASDSLTCANRTYVVRGNAASSLLYQKFTNTQPCGDCMPAGACQTASTTASKRLKRWIDELASSDTD